MLDYNKVGDTPQNQGGVKREPLPPPPPPPWEKNHTITGCFSSCYFLLVELIHSFERWVAHIVVRFFTIRAIREALFSFAYFECFAVNSSLDTEAYRCHLKVFLLICRALLLCSKFSPATVGPSAEARLGTELPSVKGLVGHWGHICPRTVATHVIANGCYLHSIRICQQEQRGDACSI